jgi:hypothetical protein
MEGYLWIIWVKLAGALWIIGGKLGSSLIFYFVAVDDWRSTTNVSRNLYSSGAQMPQRVIKSQVFSDLCKNTKTIIRLRLGDYRGSLYTHAHLTNQQSVIVERVTCRSNILRYWTGTYWTVANRVFFPWFFNPFQMFCQFQTYDKRYGRIMKRIWDIYTVFSTSFV